MKKIKLSKPIIIINYIAVIFGAIINIQMIAAKDCTATNKIASLTCLIALLCALFYILEGCNKNAALYYKVFLGFAAINQIGYIINDLFINTQDSIIAAIFNAFVIILYMYMFFGTNLGYEKSMGICILIFVVRLGIMILTANKYPGLLMGGNFTGTKYNIFAISNLVVSTIACLCTYAKYVDKKSRGAN